MQLGITSSTQTHGMTGGNTPLPRTMRFYAPIKLSDKMSETREGFLICHDVCIARTGEMLYMGNEIPDVESGRDGIVRITRDAANLFSPETMASFEGKPLTDDHPDEDVNPDNWATLAKGTLQNIHRGEGELSEFLLGDVLVMSSDSIAKVKAGEKREVSLGYDADYEQTDTGRGMQTNIVGNHIALVNKGRCGPRCAIRDRSPKMKLSIKDALARAFKAKTLDEAEGLMNQLEIPENESGATHVHVHLGEKPSEAETKDEGEAVAAAPEKTIEERMAALEAIIAKLVATDEEVHAEVEEPEAETKDEGDLPLIEEEKAEGEETAEGGEKTKTQDSASAYAEFVARAEVLAPGVRMPRPTKDAMADPKKIRDSLCLCKRRALDSAMKVEGSKAAVSKFLNTRDGMSIDKMSCDRVDAVFIGASELVKAANNGKVTVGTTRDTATADAFTRGGLDKINQAFWSKQK